MLSTWRPSAPSHFLYHLVAFYLVNGFFALLKLLIFLLFIFHFSFSVISFLFIFINHHLAYLLLRLLNHIIYEVATPIIHYFRGNQALSACRSTAIFLSHLLLIST